LRIYEDLSILAKRMLIEDISNPEAELAELARVLGNRYDLWYQFKELYVDYQILTDEEMDFLKQAFAARKNSPPPLVPENKRRHSSGDTRIPPPRPQPGQQPSNTDVPVKQLATGPNERFWKMSLSEQFNEHPHPLQRSSSTPIKHVNTQPSPSPLRNLQTLGFQNDRDDIPPSATATTEDSENPYSDDCATNNSAGKHLQGSGVFPGDPFLHEADPEKGIVPMEEVGKDYRKLFGVFLSAGRV